MAEFSRAVVQRLLEGTAPVVHYYGMFSPSQKQTAEALESTIYQHWDSLATSPPKSRPRIAVEQTIEGLHFLTMQGKTPGWPPHVLDKFPPESNERKELEKLKKEFEREFPSRGEAAAAGAGGTNPVIRATCFRPAGF